MTGITSVTPGDFAPILHHINFSLIYNIKEGYNFSMINRQPYQWLSAKISSFELLHIIVFSVLIFSLFMYLNFKIYCINVNKSKSKFYKHTKNKDLLMQLILLTLFKCIIIGIVLFAIKQKHAAVHSPRKLVNKDYFLSTEYFGDTYHAMELHTKSLHEWYAMSKIKFKSYKSFFQFLILLSGDIAMNPGPTSYPCAKCNRGVGSGVFCNTCNLWIHTKCEGLSRSQLNVLSRTGNLNFICCVYRDKQTTVYLSSSYTTPLTSTSSSSLFSAFSPLASSPSSTSLSLTSSSPLSLASSSWASSLPSASLSSTSASSLSLDSPTLSSSLSSDTISSAHLTSASMASSDLPSLSLASSYNSVTDRSD